MAKVTLLFSFFAKFAHHVVAFSRFKNSVSNTHKQSSIPTAVALFAFPSLFSSIHPFIQHSLVCSTCTHPLNHSALMCTPSRAFQAVHERVCVRAYTGLTRVPAVQPVVHQAGAGAPGRSCCGVHAQPQCGAPRPHLQQLAGHRQVGSQGTCSIKSPSESALCSVKRLLLWHNAPVHT